MSGILNVRRTLVIALGSTGMQVTEQLAEHLNWQYGSFEKAEWVRMLVVETAQPQSILGDRVLWSGMSKEEYLPYLNAPRTTGAEFGFQEWQDGPTLRDIDNPSDGAGNCRMLGRLTLFHPRTYQNLRRRVSEDIAHLQRCTPQKIADSLGEPGLTVNMHEGGVVVYVVGTLCGGTCSGGAADLGYLVDVWSGNSVRRQAIFTIPHPALSHTLGARFKKNSFFALKELNHYQLGSSVWTQKLPGADTSFVSNSRPYDITRILMPGGPADTDVKSLNGMIGQYLAAAVGPAGFDIAASDVDATGKMVGAESIGFMRPLFSSMGIAALEYPGEHIQRAATSRLLAGTYARWTTYKQDSDTFAVAKTGLGSPDVEDLLLKLTEGSDAIVTIPFQQAFKTASENEFPRAEEVRRLIRETDFRLAAQELPADALPGAPALLVQLIQNNHARYVESLSRDLDRFLERWLFDVDGGPGLIRASLNARIADLEAMEAAASEQLPGYRQDADTLRSLLDGQLAEVEKTEGAWLVLNKGERMRKAWDGFNGQLQSYYGYEVNAQTIQHLQRNNSLRGIIDQYRRVTAALLRRLEQLAAAFGQEGTILEKAWTDMAASSPGVNGKVYFDAEPPAPRGTVGEEYYKLLRQKRWPDEPATGWDDAQKERAAMAAVLQALQPLRAELSRDDGASAFDPRPAAQTARDLIPRDYLQAAEAAARSFFAPLRDQVHIADKATPGDVDTVVQASEAKLGVSAAQVSDRLAGVSGVTPMNSYLAFLDLGPTPDNPRSAIAEVAQRVRNNVELRRGLSNSPDPFRLLIIREKHGFTFGQMEGVVRSHAHDNHALQSSERCPDFKFWHTRRDVDWVDPLVPPGEVDATEEAWLFTLLLGRPATDAVPWLPASSGEIDKGGWYQLVAGSFYVYYASGADASERGATLPLAFAPAVAKLLSPEYSLLRRTLTMRFSTYVESHGAAHVVQVVDQALKSLAIFGVSELEMKEAEKIVRRGYRRNDALTRAFFEFRTDHLKNPAEFAHLRRIQGMPIEGSPDQVYPANGYYCPDCHTPLGAEIGELLAGMFLCPRCNTGKRYWP